MGAGGWRGGPGTLRPGRWAIQASGWVSVSGTNAVSTFTHNLADLPMTTTILGSETANGNEAVVMDAVIDGSKYGSFIQLTSASNEVKLKTGSASWSCSLCYDGFTGGSAGYVRVILSTGPGGSRRLQVHGRC